jgi:HD superfamily phosphohydrolase
MELATRLFEAIHSKHPEAVGEEEDPTAAIRNWQLVRLAALLHDVGHAPFSHATEMVMPEREPGLKYKHEDYTEEIIRGPLRATIEGHFAGLGITVDMIADVLNARRAATLGDQGVLLHQMVSGEMDADRMDYLARDSLFAGVEYGRYDLGRLMETATVARVRQGRPWLLAVEAGGRFALEAFLLARYYMYLQVYLHEGRCFFDIALNRFLREVLPGGTYPPPDDLLSYLRYDDPWLLLEARSRSEAGQSEWADVLWNRRLWATVEELGPYPEQVPARNWERRRGQLEGDLAGRAIFDESTAAAFRSAYLPYIFADREEDEEGRTPILVAREGEEFGRPVEEVSRIVRRLAEEEILLMRLYARSDTLSEVEDRWRQAPQPLGGEI